MSFITHKNPNSPSHLTEFVPHSDDVKPSGNFLTRLFKKSTGKLKCTFHKGMHALGTANYLMWGCQCSDDQSPLAICSYCTVVCPSVVDYVHGTVLC